MSDFQVIDNFLTDQQFLMVEKTLLGPWFPWYLQDYTDYTSDGKYQFTHLFYADCNWNGDKNLMQPFLDTLNVLALLRIKANLQPPTEKIITNQYHVDFDESKSEVMTGVFYVNTNNGKTIFKTGEEVNSVANRMVLFKHTALHTGTTCTDGFPRVVINFNFIAR